MNAIATISTHGFTAFIDELSRISGKTFEDVLLDQTAALLKICLRRTPAAKISGIVKRVSRHNNHIEFDDGHVISMWKRAPGSPTMFLDQSNFVERRGQKPPRLLSGGLSWHQVEGGSERRRWNDQRWARYKAYEGIAKAKRIDLKTAKASRGLSKQSWLQIAQELHLNMDAPAYVKNARPSTGKTYRNGTAQKLMQAAAYFIEIANDHPIVVGKLDGARMLQGAIETRLKAFDREMRLGVFSDLETRAKRYPGLFTR